MTYSTFEFSFRAVIGIAVRAAAIAKGLPINNAMRVLSNLSAFIVERKAEIEIATNYWMMTHMLTNRKNGAGFPTVADRIPPTFALFTADFSVLESTRVSGV